jgi:hypothetical protein
LEYAFLLLRVQLSSLDLLSSEAVIYRCAADVAEIHQSLSSVLQVPHVKKFGNSEDEFDKLGKFSKKLRSAVLSHQYRLV